MVLLKQILLFLTSFLCIIVAQDLNIDLEYSFDGKS